MEITRKFCEMRILTMDKLSRNVWNKPISDEEPLELAVNAIPKSPDCLVDVMMKLDDVYIKSTDEPLEEVLTDYDKLVYFAIQSIYVMAHEAGETEVPITPDMVYALMTGNRDARVKNAAEADCIHLSIEKMCRIWVSIRPNLNTQRKNERAVEIEGPFIAGHKVTGKLNGNKSSYWLISAIPRLYVYADQWNQVRRIPAAKLKSTGRYNASIGQIKEILLNYVERAKGKNISNNGLLMDKLYQQLGYDEKPKHSERIVERLKKVLYDFKATGYIKSYDLEKGARNAIRKVMVTPA